MGFRPEEKGIKTTVSRGQGHPLERWDSDLKKKGLRPTCTNVFQGLLDDGIPT